ncbi:conserved hypothetical protein [Culex quinquefasciatus]|uniref:CCHC-type domain-containing protein n=1 Tax=Culex quinquefasciatus TaxID=7176 RepID=B0W9A0_CULQU|nr:conserved hypothetical protein [Culex quinquefasciatus]|eukprot:XP_001845284.1 conserved hypothetical protein [Culex quinquefasciatus]
MMADEKQKILLIPTFHGAVKSDYPCWKVRVLHYLKREGLSHCLEKIPTKESYAEVAQYEMRLKDDDEVVTIIWHSIDNDAMKHVLGLAFAKQIMDKLDHVYERQGQLTLFAYRRQLYRLNLTSFGSLTELFTAHETLIREMERAGEQVTDDEKRSTLMAAIPDQFEYTMDALAVMRKDDIRKMTLDEFKGIFLDAEMKRKLTDEEVGPSQAFAAGREKEERTCYRCGMVGHTAWNCWQEPKWEELPAGQWHHNPQRYGRVSPQRSGRATATGEWRGRLVDASPERARGREKIHQERANVALIVQTDPAKQIAHGSTRKNAHGQLAGITARREDHSVQERQMVVNPAVQTAYGEAAWQIAHGLTRPDALNQPARHAARGEDSGVQERRGVGKPVHVASQRGMLLEARTIECESGEG